MARGGINDELEACFYRAGRACVRGPDLSRRKIGSENEKRLMNVDWFMIIWNLFPVALAGAILCWIFFGSDFQCWGCEFRDRCGK